MALMILNFMVNMHNIHYYVKYNLNAPESLLQLITRWIPEKYPFGGLFITHLSTASGLWNMCFWRAVLPWFSHRNVYVFNCMFIAQCHTHVVYISPCTADTGDICNLSQHHGCWCPGNWCCQGISSHDVGLLGIWYDSDPFYTITELNIGSTF